MEESAPYNPLAKRNLAASIVSKLLNQRPEKLPPPRFPGAGICLLYYTGPFPPYAKIAAANKQNNFAQPIYVGKAIPAGGRKGLEGFDVPHGFALSGRLGEHADSITAARNLSIDDFRCRWLVVDEVFIPLAESLLISHYKPLWNVIVEGFGNHDPGKGRISGKKPSWDVIHPGRVWAMRLSASTSYDDLLARIKAYVESTTIPPPLQVCSRRLQAEGSRTSTGIGMIFPCGLLRAALKVGFTLPAMSEGKSSSPSLLLRSAA